MKDPAVLRPSMPTGPWRVRFPTTIAGFTVVVSALAVACTTIVVGPAAGACVCGMVIIMLALPLSLARPEYLLALAIAISSTAGAFRSAGSVEVAGAAITVSGGLTAVLLVGAAVALLANPGALRREWLVDVVPFLGLAFLQVVRVPGSPFPLEALRDATLMSGPLLYYLLTRLALRQHLTSAERIERLLLYSVLIPLTVLALSVPAGGIEYDETGFHGLIGRRALALYLLVILSQALAVWRFPADRRERGLGRLLSLLSVGVIIVSLSRMASAVGLGVLLPLRYLSPGRRTVLKIGLLGVVGISFFVLLLQWPPMRQRFFGAGEVSLLRLDEAAEHMNPYGRDLLWSLTWSSALERPLTGHGSGAARQLVESWYPGVEHPHNEFLRIFHDLGLPGLFLLMWAYLSRLMRYIKRWTWSQRAGMPSCARAQMAAGLSITAVTLSMVTDNTLMYVFVLIPVFMLMGMADEVWNAASSREPTRL
jgi:O-antigen ligase